MTKQEIINSAKELKDNNPQEAYNLCRKAWNDFQEEYNNYDATFTIGLARKIDTAEFNFILELLRKFPDDLFVNSNCGWYLFDKFIKGKLPDQIREDLGQIERMLGLLKQKDQSTDTQYPCIFTIIIYKIIDAISSNVFNAPRILEFLNRLNPDFLSKVEDSYQHETKGELLTSSHLEKYYGLKTKALLKVEDYENCLAESNAALESLDNFHYDNEMWFMMRKALCLEHLDQQEESERIFKSLIQSRAGSTKWFLYRDLAVLYYDQEKYDKALIYSIEAALNGQEPKFLIKLYRFQAQVLFKLNRVNEAKVCSELVAAILQKEGWQHKEEYTRLFNYFSINLEDPISLKKVHERAVEFWASEKYKNQTPIRGTIDVIHRNGRSGHILSEYGFRYFFGRNDFLKSIRNLNGVANAEVSFYEGSETERGKKAEAIRIVMLKRQALSNQFKGKMDTGTVKNIVHFGIFIKDIFDNKEGLVHRNNLPDDFQNKYNMGDKVEIVVIGTNKKNQLELKIKC